MSAGAEQAWHTHEHYVRAYHGAQPIRRHSFVINMHRAPSPSCPYAYPHVEEAPPFPHGAYVLEDDDDLPPPALAPAYRMLAGPLPAARQPALIEDSPKKPLTLACFFCRKRKIACGSPPAGRKDRTCK